MNSEYNEKTVDSLIREELLVPSILLRTSLSERLALNPLLDFVDDGEIHFLEINNMLHPSTSYLGERGLSGDPGKDIHSLAVQESLILVQLISSKTVNLVLSWPNSLTYVLLGPFSEEQIHLEHSALTRAMNQTLSQSLIL